MRKAPLVSGHDGGDNVIPILPYGGRANPNSGHAGSETSRDRAVSADADGRTANLQHRVLGLLAEHGQTGATWTEVAGALGLHHGSASSALSTLHKAGFAARLTEVRNQCKVYVLAEYVNEREVETPGQSSTTRMLDQAICLLTRLTPCPDHSPFVQQDCLRCEAHELVKRYRVTR